MQAKNNIIFMQLEHGICIILSVGIFKRKFLLYKQVLVSLNPLIFICIHLEREEACSSFHTVFYSKFDLQKQNFKKNG